MNKFIIFWVCLMSGITSVHASVGSEQVTKTGGMLC